ncbi:MAG: DUF2846 domain-containing protein [Halioglobus sp.]
MFKYISVIITALTLSVTLSQPVAASEDSLEQGKIVVYRSDEGNKAKRLSLRLAINGDTVSRIKYEQTYVATVAPGQYTLDTNMGGTETLDVDVKAGQTRYVYLSVKATSTSVKTKLNEVEEQVAMLQQPSLSDS